MWLNNDSKQHHLEKFNEACLIVNLGFMLLQAEGKVSLSSYWLCCTVIFTAPENTLTAFFQTVATL